MNTDEQYMMRCIQLARSGMGRVAPNPMVGAVVVHNDLITGEGFHRAFGGPHAEVHALNAVTDPSKLGDSTLYVNLEPCAHHGKTPPCALRIIDAGLKRVVVGQEDPNTLVAGRGIKLMRDAGIEVEVGIRENEARHLNRRFNTFHSSGRPYVVLKWAQSADGFMDMDRAGKRASGVHWISAPATRKLVHSWRTEEMSIMIGAGTLRNDNPSLTVRDVEGRSPIRVIISQGDAIPAGATVLIDGQPTVIINRAKSAMEGQVSWVQVLDENLIDAALNYLHNNNVSSVLVEGGPKLLQSFIDAGLWDEARVIHAPITLGNGLPAPKLGRDAVTSHAYGVDRIYQYLAK